MKNKWQTTDERCPHCNSITKKRRGINKQNLKRLCFSKPSVQDILIFIMLLLCLTMFWTYSNEVEQYKSIYENPEEFCNTYFLRIQTQELPLIQGEPYEVKINPPKYNQNG